MTAKNISIPGVEIYRTKFISLHGSEFRERARTISLLHFIPVVQIEGEDTVLYAVSSGAIRKAKRPSSPQD